MGCCSKVKQSAPADKPISYLSYHGRLDYILGISMFWREKLILLILHFQRLALLLQWNLNWSHFFLKYLFYLNAFLLDFTAKHSGISSLAQLTGYNKLEGCRVICKVIWPLVCIPILLIWAVIAMRKTLPLYYTRNIERVLWTLVRLGLIPFMNTMLRYFILNQDGNLDKPLVEMRLWRSPISEIGAVILILTIGLFLYLGFKRSFGAIVFQNSIRHDSYLRARELEYKLKYSATYRNERLWMIGSYVYAGWPWSVVRSLFDIVLLTVIIVSPPQGVVIVCAIFGLEFIYTLLTGVYRCWSTALIEMIFSFFLLLFTILSYLQHNKSLTSFLVGRKKDYVLLVLIGFPVAAYIILIIYFFIKSHSFGFFLSVADKRANKKWRNIIGKVSNAGKWFKLDAVQVKDNVNMQSPDDLTKNTSEYDMFYIPNQSRFISLNCASAHVWPVNDVMIREILFRNEDDHLIDLLCAARKMLHRISIIHNSPGLIPIDEIKVYIARLHERVDYCKRYRITHHNNAIHPLQTVFEDLIEHFMFELRVFTNRSISVGHNRRNMIEVLRYLRLRMDARERSLALMSPVMRRVLMKLLALRLFIQLIDGRLRYVLPIREDVLTTIGANNSGFSDYDSRTLTQKLLRSITN
eukprot:Tbor_TRINITY_DN3404_c0_g2::TRINITY_DN3404_c0_g2_i1::g.3661::m.3661